jgi:hypothetical protein
MTTLPAFDGDGVQLSPAPNEAVPGDDCACCPAGHPDRMEVNLGNASRMVVVAELVGATGGVGYQLLQQQLFDMAARWPGRCNWCFSC